MRRKMASLLLPILAVAMLGAIPAASSAASLSYENYAPVGEGTPVTMTGFLTMTSEGDTGRCNLPINAEVLQNETNQIEFVSTYGTSCELDHPIWLTSLLYKVRMRFESEGNDGAGTMWLEFTTESTSHEVQSCYWENWWEKGLSVNYGGGTNAFTATGTLMSEACGILEFEGDFTVKNANDGRNVLLNREPVTTFISASKGTSTVNFSAEELSLGTESTGEDACYYSSASGPLVEASDELTLGGNLFNECSDPIQANGCKLRLHAGTYLRSDESGEAVTDIVCPSGKKIEIDYGPSLTVVIPPQEGSKAGSGAWFLAYGEPQYLATYIEQLNLTYYVLSNGKESTYSHDGYLKVPIGFLNATNSGGTSTDLSLGLGG